MVWSEDDSFSPAVETQTINEEDNTGISEKSTSFVIEFADSSLRVATHEDRWTAYQLIIVLADTSFEVNIFRRYIESLAVHKDVSIRSSGELMKDDRSV